MTTTTKTIYTVNNLDVTSYVMRNEEIPAIFGVKFFGIEAKEVTLYVFGE